MGNISDAFNRPESHPVEIHFDAEGFHLGGIQLGLKMFSKLTVAGSAQIALFSVAMTILNDVTTAAIWTIHRLSAYHHGK